MLSSTGRLPNGGRSTRPVTSLYPAGLQNDARKHALQPVYVLEAFMGSYRWVTSDTEGSVIHWKTTLKSLVAGTLFEGASATTRNNRASGNDRARAVVYHH